MRSYLPESADSALVSTATLESAGAGETLLRLRIETVVRLLFGEQMFIPEGWSLDSVAFLKVAHELLSAIEERRIYGSLGAAARRLSPFKIQILKDIGHLNRLNEYLARGDCSWTGFPTLQDRDREAELFARLQQSGDSDRIEAALNDAGIPEEIAAALFHLSRYLDDPNAASERKRLIQHQVSGFYIEFEPIARELERLLRVGGENEAASAMAAFRSQCDASPDLVKSSSGVRLIAEQHLSPRILELVNYAIRVLYMARTSRDERAMFSGPAQIPGRETFLTNADGSLLAVAGGAPGAARFEQLRGADAKLRDLLSLQDWREIWRSAVDLAVRPDWRERVAQYRQTDPRDIAQVGEMQRKLEDMLEASCPLLVLRQCRGGRWGLGVRVSRGLETLVIAGVVSSPFFFFAGPAVAGLAMGGSATLQAAAPELLKEAISPLSSNVRASTIFRLTG